MQERKAARELSQKIDRLLSKGSHPGQERGDGPPSPLAQEMAIACRLSQIGERLPPVPEELERRVRAIVRSPPVERGRSWRSAALGALAATAVFVLLWIVVPGGQRVVAGMMRTLLGQTLVELTPTLDSDIPSREVREPLRDLVAAELLMGRAPSLPKTLPEGYVLLEIVAVSYPDLPSWISQPFFIELSYGPEGARPGLRLREYRLLFKEIGGISGFQVAGGAVIDYQQVEVSGVPSTLLTLSRDDREIYTLLWERDGLLLELETDVVDKEELLHIAGSVR